MRPRSTSDSAAFAQRSLRFCSASRRTRLGASCALLTASLWTLNVSDADAQPIPGAGNIVVHADGGCVEVERAPFRMKFFDGKCKVVHGKVTGTPALAQVANANTAPFVIPPTTDIEPNGTQNSPDVAFYAPLFYEVGGQELHTFNRTSWIGNMYAGGRGGYAFGPTAVLFAERLDLDGDASNGAEGVKLVLATNEPPPFPEAPPEAYRLMFVTLAPDGTGAVRVRANLSYPFGVINMGDAFVNEPSEAFHGFGGRHVGVDMRGRRFYSWVEQENLGGGIIELAARQAVLQAGLPPEYLPAALAEAARYMFPNGPMAAYYPQNLFVSSKPYGVLVANSEFTRWRLQNADKWQFSVASTGLDYTVALGPASRVVKTLTRINGRNLLPPEWAQGATISRTVQLPLSIPNPDRDPNLPPDPTDLVNVPGTGDTPDSYWLKIQDDLANIEAYDMPVSAYAFEGWSVLKYAHDSEGNLLGDAAVQQVIARLRARNIRPIAYVRPYFSTDGLLTQDFDDYAEVTSLHLVTKKLDGVTDYIWRDRNDAGLLDITNPDAVEWLSQRLRAMLDLGFDGFHSDFGEQVTDDMYFVGTGETGLTMHNKYPVLLAQITRTITDAYQAAHPERGEIFFFSRSGYSGRHGSAAYDQANHPGDATTDWTVSSGIGSQIPDMLNRAIGGNYGWNIDIGGYADFVPQSPDPMNPAYQGTSRELFIRWTQLAALTPYFRVHNSGLTGVRQPWSFDADTREIWREMAQLHAAAVPYMRKAWEKARGRDKQGVESEAGATGIPVTRPLWLAFPEDPNATRIDDEYMLGDDVLVAPVVKQGATSRDVYFPAGCWVNANTGLEYASATGTLVAAIEAPLEWLPHFFRCGANPFDHGQ